MAHPDDESATDSDKFFEDNNPLTLRSEEAESDDTTERVFNEGFKQNVPTGERRASRQLWLISYADFMTILMIFFLAMYGYTYLAKASLLKAQKKRMSYDSFAEVVGQLNDTLHQPVKVIQDIDKMVVQIGEKILFASGSAELTPAAVRTLAELAISIKLVEGDVIVQGHTDNKPIKGGKFPSNWELSAARSFAVIQSLIENGVPAERLAAWGFGENRPLVDNNTEENAALNRRIDIVILKKNVNQG